MTDRERFLEKLNAAGLNVYVSSVSESGGTFTAAVRKGLEKYLAAAGNGKDLFEGTEEDGFRICPLTHGNAAALRQLFPFTAPQSHRGHRFTMGFGDRLGLATAGHIRAIRGTDIFPVFAQQSIRELNLTHRTFADVIDAATFLVFQEGYRGGFGADGDHLKTKEEIRYALSSGCSMITLDCSEHIDQQAALLPQEKIDARYRTLPEEIRTHYEETYLGRELPVIGRLAEDELRRIVVVFYRGVLHAADCFRYIDRIREADVDLELSIDETLTITTPAEHFVIGNEMALAGIQIDSCAPHFSGYFEKGIEYIGCVDDFARDFEVHEKIAEHFGYKLSLHSGSDKFSVFSTVGRVTKGNVHVKTAGTSWLEAMRVVAEKEPALYRRAHRFAIEHRPEAEKYYHVTTKASEIPNIDLESDVFLPEYLNLAPSRQTMHIAYGVLLSEDWFRKAFFRAMAEHEEEYYAGLERHLGRHIRLLLAEA